jgi:23S rRNA (uracil1939-C5)-methyltransferase
VFQPTDFTQVNGDINRHMVRRAIQLLDLEATDRVLDLFCGLGNFSLPLARQAEQVVGVEGSPDMIQRARDNARRNGIDNAVFYTGDLSQPDAQAAWVRQGAYDKVLLDPPRTGALEVLDVVASFAPSRVVYVSCNPATLARDAGKLVHEHGYSLDAAGVMDMFPHTTHVESIAVFNR